MPKDHKRTPKPRLAQALAELRKPIVEVGDENRVLLMFLSQGANEKPKHVHFGGEIDFRRGSLSLFEPGLLHPHWQLYCALIGNLVQADAGATYSKVALRRDQIWELYRKHEKRSDNKPQPTNSQFFGYSDSLMRLAYHMFCVPRHAVDVYLALQHCGPQVRARVLQAWDHGLPFRVTSFGGGPVADLLGLLAFLQRLAKEAGRSVHLQYTSLDLRE
mmetsp:Transcript_113813/g.197792  ORF Transcript_113813/g.197792 Transcript_113813/m.197792 type:complete len:217 (+) Transcript_113813:211-861(+)